MFVMHEQRVGRVRDLVRLNDDTGRLQLGAAAERAA
jgi:hypothetical protein